MTPYAREYRQNRLRHRSKGQSELLGTGLALIIIMMLFISMINRKHESDLTETNIALGQDIGQIAKSAGHYIHDNYSAILLKFENTGASQLNYALSCNQNYTGYSCLLPTAKVPSLQQSIADAGYIPEERTNINQKSQNYILSIRRDYINGNYNLTAIVTVSGPKTVDGSTQDIADNTELPSSYEPINGSTKGPFINATWMTNNGLWNGIVTPGHVAVSLDNLIGDAVTGGSIQRHNGGSTDTRAQTMHRSLYFGKNSATGQSANICFCTNPTTGGSYAGPCAIPQYKTSESNPYDTNANACKVPQW